MKDRASAMRRFTPSSTMPATGILSMVVSVAARVKSPAPATPAKPFEVNTSTLKDG